MTQSGMFVTSLSWLSGPIGSGLDILPGTLQGKSIMITIALEITNSALYGENWAISVAEEPDGSIELSSSSVLTKFDASLIAVDWTPTSFIDPAKHAEHVAKSNFFGRFFLGKAKN